MRAWAQRPLVLSALFALALSSCTGEDAQDERIDGLFSPPEWARIQSLSPLPDPLPADTTNAFADSAAAAALGQLLFFDPRPAGPLQVGVESENGGLGQVGETGKVACASCHMGEDGWFQDRRSNPSATSLGVSWGPRNAPSLVNAAFYAWFRWDGGADSMWVQALDTTEAAHSHGSSRLAVAHAMARYRDQYMAAFGGPLHAEIGMGGRFPSSGKPGEDVWEQLVAEDREIVNRVFANYGKALAAYQRRLVSRNAPFDRYVAGDTAALSSAAKRGLKLFIGKAGCVGCHNTPLLSDNRFHNSAVRQEGTYVPTEDIGRLGAVAPVIANPFNVDGVYSDDRQTEKLAGLAAEEVQRGQFRTKHLRQIAETGPYMHTGQFASLLEVVEHYNQGGAMSGFSGEKDPLMVPLNLTRAEVDDLVAFLGTLTGEPIPESLRQTTALP